MGRCAGSDRPAQRRARGGEGLGLLADEAAGLAGGLDRGLLDRGDRGVELIDGRRGDGHEAGDAQDAVPGGQVRLLLEDVVQFGAGGGVFDLPDLAPGAWSLMSSVFFFRRSRAA